MTPKAAGLLAFLAIVCLADWAFIWGVGQTYGFIVKELAKQ